MSLYNGGADSAVGGSRSIGLGNVDPGLPYNLTAFFTSSDRSTIEH